MTARRITRLESVLASVKEIFREPHPFGRNPQFLKPHAAPWFSVYALRQVRTAAIFIPGMALYFGWPFAAKAFIEWKNGVYTKTLIEVKPPQPKHTSSKIKRMILLQQGPKVLDDVAVEKLPALPNLPAQSV